MASTDPATEAIDGFALLGIHAAPTAGTDRLRIAC